MNARLRRIIITVGIAIASIVVLLIIGYSQLLSYLQGNDFRHYMADNLRKVLQAGSVEIHSNLAINGNRVSIDGASLSGMGSIQEARAGRISTEIDRAALFSRQIHLHKLSMEDASLSLTTGSTQPKPARRTKSSKISKKKAVSQPAKSTGKPSPPAIRGIQVDELECKDADLNLLHNGNQYQLLGANVTATPAPRIGENAWQLNAENARLHTPFPFLRDCSIKSSTLVYHGQSVDVTECRIMLSPGEMRVKAHYDIKSTQWNLDMQVNKGNLHRLLNDDWKKRATGDLYGRLTLTGKGGATITGTGAFSVQNGVLEGLPFLSQLPVGNTYPYRSIELEKADCQVLFPYNSDQHRNAWLFDKINIRSRDGSLLVRGHVLIGTDRSLGGTLNIGLPRSIVLALPLPQEDLAQKLFTPSGDEDDYLWLNMNLSGTIDQPQEDLSIRISTLVGNKLLNILTPSRRSASELLNILLQQKPEPAETTETPDTDQKSASPLQDAANAAGSLLQSLF